MMTVLLILSNSVAIAAEMEALQMKNCLAERLDSQFILLAKDKEFSIVDVPAQAIESIGHIAEQYQCGRFININNELKSQTVLERKQAAKQLLQQKVPAHFSETVYSLRHPEEVRAFLTEVVPDNIWQTVAQMSSFTNRSSTQVNGKNAALWLQEKFEKMAMEYGRTDVSTFFVETQGRYIQPSLVTVIGKNNKVPAIVIGAHMDTLGDNDFVRMPGADDDASGSASAMEIARVLLASKINFKRPIYIVFYAAEEMGLVGSRQVVKYFNQNAIPVHAVLQLDMTGYRKNENHKDETMWIFKDYTDSNLNDFIAQLITTYVGAPVEYSQCGYGCSDHVSWNTEGIPVAFPCETSFEDYNPDIHTAKDKMDPLDIEHMTNFTKLGIAFAVELALT